MPLDFTVGDDGYPKWRVRGSGADTWCPFKSVGRNVFSVGSISGVSSTTIDIKPFLPSDYVNLTESNFYTKNSKTNFWAWEVGSFAGKSHSTNFSTTFSYDSTTGILTVTSPLRQFQLSDVAIKISITTEIWCEY